jgi:hypothetical protein
MLRSACAHLEMELPFIRRITSLYLSEFTDLPMASRFANQRNKYMMRARSGEDTLTSGPPPPRLPWKFVRPVLNKHLESDIDRYESRSGTRVRTYSCRYRNGDVVASTHQICQITRFVFHLSRYHDFMYEFIAIKCVYTLSTVVPVSGTHWFRFSLTGIKLQRSNRET